MKYKIWDFVKALATAERILNKHLRNVKTHARSLEALARESGAWLNVLRISSLDLRMDNDRARVVAGLQLGALLCNAICVAIEEQKQII